MSEFSPGFVWDIIEGTTIDSAGAWLFDDLVPPSAPIVREVMDKANVGMTERLGYKPVVNTDRRLDGARAGVSKQIALMWPRSVDTRFWQYLRNKYVFVVPIWIEVPILSPIDRELCYTPPDDDSQYLLVYYGKERWWKTNSVTIYRNGTLVDSGEYTVDYQNGSVTFAVTQVRTDEIAVLYTYRAPYIIIELISNFVPGYADLTVLPEIILEEVVES